MKIISLLEFTKVLLLPKQLILFEYHTDGWKHAAELEFVLVTLSERSKEEGYKEEWQLAAKDINC